MKFLCIGDPHFKTDNYEETNDFIKKLENYIKENLGQIDYIIVLGDILHNHEKLHTSALNIATNFFKMLISYKPNKVYCLVGNHDAISNTIFLTDNHWLNILKEWNTITVVDKPLKLELENNKFVVMCPYVPDGMLHKALNFIPEWQQSQIIFAHQLLDGAKMGAVIAENVEEWKNNYPLLISGHIHDKQKVKKNLYYTGSSLQHAYGESNDKTISLVNVDTLKIDEIDLKVMTKRIVYVDAENLKSLKLDVKENENVKLVVSGDYNFFKEYKNTEFIKEKFKEVDKIIFKQKNIERKQNKYESINDYLQLIEHMVKEEKEEELYSFYQHIIYNKEDKSEIVDVLIIE
jgi:UDP-2,3-diacylglucosamine pyrophosphatase LpxH